MFVVCNISLERSWEYLSNIILHTPKFINFQLLNQNQQHTHNKCDKVKSGTSANLKVATHSLASREKGGGTKTKNKNYVEVVQLRGCHHFIFILWSSLYCWLQIGFCSAFTSISSTSRSFYVIHVHPNTFVSSTRKEINKVANVEIYNLISLFPCIRTCKSFYTC